MTAARDNYQSTGGGSLRIKGIKGAKSYKIKKSKSSGSKTQKNASSRNTTVSNNSQAYDQTDQGSVQQSEREEHGIKGDSSATYSTKECLEMENKSVVTDDTTSCPLRTPAEVRHEQRRRKLLNDRLKREGIKTHKERVEDLNKYLSGLSEHHDMPRIGPG